MVAGPSLELALALVQGLVSLVVEVEGGLNYYLVEDDYRLISQMVKKSLMSWM
jgi:hypothetical protein